MIIVGLDLSLTSAGIAILRDGRPKVITHIGHGGHNGDDYAHRSRRIVSQCRAIMAVLDQSPKIADPRKPSGTRWQFDLAVLEGPSFGNLTRPSGHDGAGLWWGVFSALAAKRIPTAVIAPSTLKLWFTGAGDATKLRMLNTARGRFREPISTHDEADAIAAATAGAYRLGDPVPFDPNERQIAALAKVEWLGR